MRGRVAGRRPALTSAGRPPAAVWEVPDRMEEAVGLDLFEPVVAHPSWWTDDTTTSGGEPFEPGIIRLVHAPPQWRGLPRAEEDGSVRDRDLGSWVGNGRFSAFRERHRPRGSGCGGSHYTLPRGLPYCPAAAPFVFWVMS
ncbi:MAG: hypothetical protein ACOC9H_00700 [Gemmatimonadota bacterium]